MNLSPLAYFTRCRLLAALAPYSILFITIMKGILFIQLYLILRIIFSLLFHNFLFIILGILVSIHDVIKVKSISVPGTKCGKVKGGKYLCNAPCNSCQDSWSNTLTFCVYVCQISFIHALGWSVSQLSQGKGAGLRPGRVASPSQGRMRRTAIHNHAHIHIHTHYTAWVNSDSTNYLNSF